MECEAGATEAYEVSRVREPLGAVPTFRMGMPAALRASFAWVRLGVAANDRRRFCN